MTLVLRIVETEDGPCAYITKEEDPRPGPTVKVIRQKNGKALRGLLNEMAEYNQLLPELVLFAQHAFDLGREYAEEHRVAIDAGIVAKRLFGYKGLPDQKK